jgi:hypothetical protein
MPTTFEMLRPGDKPALVAVTTPEWRDQVQAALVALSYKVHVTDNHDECLKRFAQAQYQLVVFEEGFAGSAPGENASLKVIQTMAMPLRRHATFVLLGAGFRTLDPMQAYVHSVHVVVDSADLASLPMVLLRAVTDNDAFLSMYRESQARQAQGK